VILNHLFAFFRSFGYNAMSPGIGKDKVTKQLHINQEAVKKLLGKEVADLVELKVVPKGELAQYITDAKAAMTALQTRQVVTTTGAMVTESLTAAVKQDGDLTRDAIESQVVAKVDASTDKVDALHKSVAELHEKVDDLRKRSD